MAPNHNFVLTDASGEPVSRTYQYRKVMKPMLERKRRARINRCLDELKELMTSALQTEGENVAKLEKADILELTVRHLHSLRRQNVLSTRSENSYAEKFRAGFRHCAAEVSSFLNVVDQKTSSQILKHLNTCINHMERSTPTNGIGAVGAVAAAVHIPHQQYPTNRLQPINVPANRPSIQIQSPNQINAQLAVGAHAPHGWPTKDRQQQYFHSIRMQDNYSNRSANSTPESLNESSTRINTPPLSPKIDIDDSSVWRPW